MQLKTWVLDAVNKVNALFARSDLPPREMTLRVTARPSRAAHAQSTEATDAAPAGDEHLGPYAPLIAALREELEQFVATQVRLHLAIAEHDRFMLTSIELRSVDAGEPLQLLQRFTREFKPEQIKRYLMREVVPGLPNASALDLSQFGGLAVLAQPAADEDEEFGELLQALNSAGSATDGAYQVRVKGRWAEGEPAVQSAPSRALEAARTPLLLELDIEDAGGSRRMTLPSVVPGRRYLLGNGDGCDIAVDGAYTSRRHCEIWLDQGAWWVLDAGSTNGIRVELGARVLGRGSAQPDAGARQDAIRLVPGARIVLSALADGPRGDYPGVALRIEQGAAALVTPIAPAARSPKMSLTPITPITPIVVAARPASTGWVLTVHMVSGDRSVTIDAARLPFAIGRSRNQALVVDHAHEGVSGHHLDIIGIDEAGAAVLVHGDNGVIVDQASHPARERFVWRAGETMVLGRAQPQEPVCMLTLQRRS